jgi:hypothetical protein
MDTDAIIKLQLEATARLNFVSWLAGLLSSGEAPAAMQKEAAAQLLQLAGLEQADIVKHL